MKNTDLPKIPSGIFWKDGIPKGMSLTPRSSPRCMLKIPGKELAEELQAQGVHLPLVGRSKSAANTPIRAPTRIAKDKNYEFPEISNKKYNVIVTQDEEEDKYQSGNPEELELNNRKYCENYDLPDFDEYLKRTKK